MHPFDHVGKDVRRGMLDRRRQVNDALALRVRLPHLCHGVHDALAKRELRSREHLWRVLEHPVRSRLLGGELGEETCVARGQLHDAVLVEPEHDLAHHRRSRVVEVHDRAPGTAQRFESAADERLARLREDLDRHIVGNELLIDELADEIELDLRR